MLKLPTLLTNVTETAESSGGFHISGADILLILVVVIALLLAALYMVNRWAAKKYDSQQEQIARMKERVTMYVIDKKHDYMKNVNLPKIVVQNTPKLGKAMKMYFIKAKIGPQIITLFAEKNVYNAIPVKKTIKAEIAGLYVLSFDGLKSAKEMKQIRKEKKEKAKAERKAEKSKK